MSEIPVIGSGRLYTEAEVAALRAENERLRRALGRRVDGCGCCGDSDFAVDVACDECHEDLALLTNRALAAPQEEKNHG